MTTRRHQKIYLDLEVIRDLQSLCLIAGISLSGFAEEAIKRHIEETLRALPELAPEMELERAAQQSDRRERLLARAAKGQSVARDLRRRAQELTLPLFRKVVREA